MAELLFRIGAEDGGFEKVIGRTTTLLGELEQGMVKVTDSIGVMGGKTNFVKTGFASLTTTVEALNSRFIETAQTGFILTENIEDQIPELEALAQAYANLANQQEEGSIEQKQLTQSLAEVNQRLVEYKATLEAGTNSVAERIAIEQSIRSQGLKTKKSLLDQIALWRDLKEGAQRIGDTAATEQATQKIRELGAAMQDSVVPGLSQLNSLGIQSTAQTQRRIKEINKLLVKFKDDKQATIQLINAKERLTLSIDKQVQSQQSSRKATTSGAFAFQNLGFAIQDSAQFSQGFSTGMRAIGNNLDSIIGSLFRTNDLLKASNGSWGALIKSLAKSPIAILLAVNAITSAIQIISQFQKANKVTVKDLEKTINTILEFEDGLSQFSIAGSSSIKSLETDFRDGLSSVRGEIIKTAGAAKVGATDVEDIALEYEKIAAGLTRAFGVIPDAFLTEQTKQAIAFEKATREDRDALAGFSDALKKQSKDAKGAEIAMRLLFERYTVAELAVKDAEASIKKFNAAIKTQAIDVAASETALGRQAVRLQVINKLQKERIKSNDLATQAELSGQNQVLAIEKARQKSSQLTIELDKERGGRVLAEEIGAKEQLLELEKQLTKEAENRGKTAETDLKISFSKSRDISRQIEQAYTTEGQNLTLQEAANKVEDQRLANINKRTQLGSFALQDLKAAVDLETRQLAIDEKQVNLAQRRRQEAQGDFTQQTQAVDTAVTSEQERQNDLADEYITLIDSTYQSLILVNAEQAKINDHVKELNELRAVDEDALIRDLARIVEIETELARVNNLRLAAASSAEGAQAASLEATNKLLETQISNVNARTVLSDKEVQDLKAKTKFETTLIGIEERREALRQRSKQEAGGDFSQAEAALAAERTAAQEQYNKLSDKARAIADEELRIQIHKNKVLAEQNKRDEKISDTKLTAFEETKKAILDEIKLRQEGNRVEAGRTLILEQNAAIIAGEDIEDQIQALKRRNAIDEARLDIIARGGEDARKLLAEEAKALAIVRRAELEAITNQNRASIALGLEHEVSILEGQNALILERIRLEASGDEGGLGRRIDELTEISAILDAINATQEGSEFRNLTVDQAWAIDQVKEAAIAAGISMEELRLIMEKLGQTSLQSKLSKLSGELSAIANTTLGGFASLSNELSEGARQSAEEAAAAAGASTEAIAAAGNKAAEKWFERNKKVRIAQAVMNTAAGITDVLAHNAGRPLYSAALIAGVIATGAAQVAAIRRTTIGSASISTQGVTSAPGVFDDLGSQGAQDAFAATPGGGQQQTSTSTQSNASQSSAASTDSGSVAETLSLTALTNTITDAIASLSIPDQATQQFSFDAPVFEAPTFNAPIIEAPSFAAPSFPIPGGTSTQPISIPQVITVHVKGETTAEGRVLRTVLRNESQALVGSGITTLNDPLGLRR
jgi:hypothetical protein